MSFWKKGQRTDKINTSRINLIFATIFLLAGLIVFKLFNLQLFNHEFYKNLASSQQQIYSQLQPQRGRIFIQNDNSGDKSQLYPVATNKNFALIYAVPKEIKDAARAEQFSQQLYLSFHQAEIEKEVDELLEKEESDSLKAQLNVLGDLSDEASIAKQAEIIVQHEKLLADKLYQETRRARREQEINLRKKSLTDEFFKKLTKANDLYEPLEQKVEEIDLNFFYLALNRPVEDLSPADLEIENNALFIINHGKRKEFKIDGLGFTASAYRYYPEKNIGANLLGFVGYAGDEQTGRYGLEEFFNQELTGKVGSIKVERDAKGEAIIINDRQYQKPEDGGDLILTINRSIQYVACTKLNEAVARHGADGGSVIILEPKTGAILAMCSNPDFDGNNYQEVKNIKDFINPAVFNQYEPGSIFKVITMAMALDQKKITPQTTYNDTGQVVIDKYTIENSDHKANGVQNMIQVLDKSLNTGAIFAMRQIGPDAFADYLKSFGFGEKTGLEISNESKGDIGSFLKKPVRELYAATAAFGQGIAVTPLQMASAFQAIANNGVLMKPYLVKEIIRPDGTSLAAQPTILRQVISEKAATIIGGMMVDVVENGHGKRAAVSGYWVGGKTGTAQVPKKDGRGYDANNHIGSFAGFAPVNDPKFVMLVRIDHPRDVDWAESSAAPLFGELAQYMLNYWQVPKERKTDN